MSLETSPNMKNGYDTIYLAACALHREIPAAERIRSMDLAAVYHMAKYHSMQSITYMALESWIAAGNDASEVFDPELHKKWKDANSRTIRKNILFDAEREKLFTFMDEQNIWYMPLKGVILQDFYPEYGMRQMVDNDILFDSDYRDTIRKYFLSNGYTEAEEEAEAHDVYQKSPFYNFEMHFYLYRLYRNKIRHEYYRNVRERLIPKGGAHPLEYRFTEEDFYIYCTAHAYKHFSNTGIGIRTLMDVYVYLSALEDQLNWTYIEAECEKLGMKKYERSARALAKKLFREVWETAGTGADSLTEEERSLAEYYITSGTHGTRENFIVQEIRSKCGDSRSITFAGRMKYFMSRLFPDAESLQRDFPFFYQHKILLPFLVFYRGFRALVQRPEKLFAEFKLIWKTKN